MASALIEEQGQLSKDSRGTVSGQLVLPSPPTPIKVDAEANHSQALATLVAPSPCREEVRKFSGTYSAIEVSFKDENGPRVCQKITVSAISVTGSALLTYELRGSPHESTARSLAAFFTSLPSTANIDTKLAELYGLTEKDTALSWELVEPHISGPTKSIPPMMPELVPFLAFVAEPWKARDRFFCSKKTEHIEYSLHGEVDTHGRVATLSISKATPARELVERDEYAIHPQRHDLRTEPDWHKHLKTRLWEIMDRWWSGGDEAILAHCEKREKGESEALSFDDLMSATSSLEERIHTFKYNPDYAQFRRELPGGTNVTLEIDRDLALLGIELRAEPMRELIVGAFRAHDPHAGFTQTETDILKAIVSNLCSQSDTTRTKAIEEFASRSFMRRHGVLNSCELVQRCVEKEKLPLQVKNDLFDDYYLQHLLLKGYQPAKVVFDRVHDVAQHPAIFCSMSVGIKPDYSLRVELKGLYQQRCVFEAAGGVYSPKAKQVELLERLLKAFSKQPDLSWSELLRFFGSHAASHPKAALSLCSPYHNLRLPAVNDAVSQRSYERAGKLLEAIHQRNNAVTFQSGINYLSSGKSQLVIHGMGGVARLALTLSGQAITELAVYDVDPFDLANAGTPPFMKTRCMITNLESEETISAVRRLASVFVETFGHTKASTISPETVKRDPRALLPDRRFEALFHRISQTAHEALGAALGPELAEN